MDQIVIDLSELEASDAHVGREVVLLSDQPDSNVGLHPIARAHNIMGRVDQSGPSATLLLRRWARPQLQAASGK